MSNPVFLYHWGKIWYIPCAQRTKLKHILSMFIVTMPINMLYMCWDNLQKRMLMMQAYLIINYAYFLASCFRFLWSWLTWEVMGDPPTFLLHVFTLLGLTLEVLGDPRSSPSLSILFVLITSIGFGWLNVIEFIFISIPFPSCYILNSSLEYNLVHEWYQIWFHH